MSKKANLLWFFLLIVSFSTEVSWLSPLEHDFGDIIQFQPVQQSFEFKNEGDAPLLIDNVRTTCGCTATNWPEDPIPPGKQAAIEVEYDAKKAGYFEKPIKVYFHGIRKPVRLRVEGYVVEQ